MRRVRLGNWTFRWNWCSPGGYRLRYWLLQWGFYPGLTCYVRVAGFLVQAWDVRNVVRPNREEWRVT